MKIASGMLFVAFACMACNAPAEASESAYPRKPVRLVAVNLPGGGADIVARTVGQKLSEHFGQQFVVDNRPAVSGILGADLVARSTPDGHTLLMGSSSHTITASLFTDLPYDPVKDFAPISMLVSAPYLMVAHPSLQANSVSDIIALARAKPGHLNYAAGGIAVGSTLAGELFKTMAGVNIVMVPYKGAPQATADVAAGQVQLGFSTMPAGLPLVKAGRLRALAVTGARRTGAAPNIPTIAESGLPGFEVQTWFGMFAPSATPRPIIAQLLRQSVDAIRQAEIRDKLSALGYDIVGTNSDEFARLIKSEIAKWGKVVKAAGIKPMSMAQ